MRRVSLWMGCRSCLRRSRPGRRTSRSPLQRRAPAMAKLGRSTTIRCLFLGVLVFAATSWAQTRPPIAEQIAKTYGLDSFGQIEAIRYTFNLDLPALKVSLSRTWTWEPKTGL